MEQAVFINKQLEKTYGKAEDGRVIFRVVWSDSQRERRLEDVYHGLFLPYPIIQDLPKYSYISERWVLEKLVYHPCKEIPESANGHYEPVYVFQDKDGNYLTPHFWACQAAIDSLNRPPQTKGQAEAKQAEHDQKTYDKTLAIIQNESPYLATMLHNKEAIVVPDLEGTKDAS